MKYIPLLIGVIISVPSAQTDMEMPHIGVHEWGVITWERGTAFAQGAPCDYFDEVVTRAPVVYFHGPEFSGRFEVAVDNGQIIELYPVDGAWSSDSHVWAGDFVLGYLPIRDITESRGIPVPSDFGWALEYWREPEVLTFNGFNGLSEKFLYYETTMDDVTFMPLYPGSEPDIERGGHFDLEILLLGMDDGKLMATTCTLARFEARTVIPLTWEIGIGPEGSEILDVFYEWSRDLIDVQEVDALWNTWMDWFTFEAIRTLEGSGADAIAVYLLPADLTDNVSTLFLETEEGYPIDYSRYLLVAVPVSI